MEVLERDPDRPRFHVMPVKGWLNDPNGPIYYQGRYHLFYQHVPDRVEWDWGLVWGHAVSEDLIFWEHLPVAIEPTPRGFDSDGCFSGCCALNEEGLPTLLYTGVKLRSNFDESSPLPPKECDLQLPFIETQLAAVADPSTLRNPILLILTLLFLDDDFLKSFKKCEKPIVSLPPPDSNLTGWRDPFMVKGRHKDGNLMLIGSGIKGQGGTILKYTSNDILTSQKDIKILIYFLIRLGICWSFMHGGCRYWSGMGMSFISQTNTSRTTSKSRSKSNSNSRSRNAFRVLTSQQEVPQTSPFLKKLNSPF